MSKGRNDRAKGHPSQRESGGAGQRRSGRGRAARSLVLALGGAALCALCWSTSCRSTALSLDDPNELNVTFDPDHIAADVFELPTVHVRFAGVQGAEAGARSDATPVVGEWDFGEGLFLRSWEFIDNKDFSLDIGIKRFADAPKGRRTLRLKIHNSRGTFLALGVFTVL